MVKRLVVDIDYADLRAFSALDIGYDVNGDNDIQWTEEAMCYSALDGGDYCAINDPIPGRYWMIVSNYKDLRNDPDNQPDAFRVAKAIVMEGDAGNASLTGPDGEVASGTPYSVALNHELSDTNEGDIYYGLVELGSDAFNTNNLGNVGVKLSVGGDDVRISASQTAVKAGEVVSFEVEVLPNLSGGERPLTLDVTLPDGLSLVDGTVIAESLNDLAEQLTVEGNSISLATTQPSSLAMARNYVFTTNLTDDQCRVPYGDDPVFYDLAANYSPMAVEGTADNVTIIPRSLSNLPYVPLYGMEEEHATDYLAISPFGYVQFDTGFHFFNAVYPFDENYNEFPATQIAPLWRGDVVMPGYYFDYERGRNVNVAYAVVDEDYYIFQWDGGQEQFINIFQDNPTPDENSYYSIQSFVSLDLSFAQGDYELVYAYNTIDTANPQYGSIGVKGYVGELGVAGPYNGYLTNGFAYNNVDEVVSEGTVICGDYRGPEQTAITVKFDAKVAPTAIGAENVVSVTSQYEDSESITQAYTISAPSNIHIGNVNDMTVAENETTESVAVLFTDALSTSNSLSVEGANVSASIDGFSFTLTPDANWYGETEVTVTVYDNANPNDAASTQFILTVVSDGVELGCTDATANNYDESANADDGSCTYPQVEENKPKKSGGTIQWTILLLLPLVLIRRKLQPPR